MGIIVTAKNSGRGMVRPFGTYSKAQKGSKVWIGDKSFTVSTGGRVNIPKKIMETGLKGNDGRYRIEIEFKTEPGAEHWRNVKARVSRPFPENANRETGERATTKSIHRDFETSEEMISALESGIEAGELIPGEISEKNWS